MLRNVVLIAIAGIVGFSSPAELLAQVCEYERTYVTPNPVCPSEIPDPHYYPLPPHAFRHLEPWQPLPCPNAIPKVIGCPNGKCYLDQLPKQSPKTIPPQPPNGPGFGQQPLPPGQVPPGNNPPPQVDPNSPPLPPGQVPPSKPVEPKL